LITYTPSFRITKTSQIPGTDALDIRFIYFFFSQIQIFQKPLTELIMHANAKLALVSLLAGTSDAFWRMSCPGRVLRERADPIVNPGGVAGHLHTISGGNGFGFSMDYDQARASQCSSCTIKQDFSNYWTPQLFYKAQNGSVIPVPVVGDDDDSHGGMTVYYL
jgi:hypothetical protein